MFVVNNLTIVKLECADFFILSEVNLGESVVDELNSMLQTLSNKTKREHVLIHAPSLAVNVIDTNRNDQDNVRKTRHLRKQLTELINLLPDQLLDAKK